MRGETPSVNELQNEASQGDIHGVMVYCPGCKDEVPSSLYCLKCGYPLYNVSREDGEYDGSSKPYGEDLSTIESMDAPTEHCEASDHSDVTNVGENAMDPGLDMHEVNEGSTAAAELGHQERGVESLHVESEQVGANDVEIVIEEGIDEPMEEIVVEEARDQEALESLHPSEKVSDVPWETLMSPPNVEEAESGAVFEPDQAIIVLTKDLMNSISLTLWSVDLLLEGSIEEEHFNRLFEGYQARSKGCMARRQKMLEQAQDLGLLEKIHTEAKVGLWELEVRNSIGDLQEGEYEAKAPSFKWEIRHSEEEIARRRGEIEFLEDPTKVLPVEKIMKMKESGENVSQKIDSFQKSGSINEETAEKVKASLEETLVFLTDLK